MNKRRLCAMLAVGAGLLTAPLWGLQLAVWVWDISDQGRPLPTPTPYSLPAGYLDEIQWLPNGEGVVVSHARKIYLVGADGSKRRLDEGSSHLHNSLMISIHPSSSHVAYLSNSGTGWHDSYRTWIDELQPGYERYHLGNLESFDDGFHSTWPDHFPAWSPDATQIAFFDEGVLRTAPAGATPSNIGELVSRSEEVALCTGSCRALVWSPDGRRLAFTGEQNNEPEATNEEDEQRTEELKDFRRLAPNRVSLADVYEGTSFQFDVIGGHTPSWSPDGQLLAFAGWNTNIEPSIYTVNADGSNLRAMRGIPWQPGRAHSTLEFYYWKALGSYGAMVNSISWSADSSTILYTLNDNESPVIAGLNRLHYIDISALGGPSYRFMEPEFGVGAASWSPDGSRIAVYADANGDMRLYTIAPDGSDVRWLAGGG